MVVGKATGSNDIHSDINFAIAKDALLRSATIMEQDDILSGLAFVGHNDLFVEVKITWSKIVQLQRAFMLLFRLFSIRNKSIAAILGVGFP